MHNLRQVVLSGSLALFVSSLSLGSAAHAQQTTATVAALESPTLVSSSSVTPDLPDDPQASSSAPQSGQGGQTKRILGVVPNFRAVSADTKLPPQSVKDKFVTAAEDSFDYSSLLLPAVIAAYSQIRNTTPEFHEGAPGYARYYWHSYVDQASENFFVEAIVPSITRQDNRYYTLGKGGFVKRTEYSLSRAFITRNDAGRNVFNASEIVGAGAAAGLSNLYYPSRERTFGDTAGKWGQSVGIDAATFMFKEFWPDINQRFFHSHD